jgi:hypothetical protein
MTPNYSEFRREWQWNVMKNSAAVRRGRNAPCSAAILMEWVPFVGQNPFALG